MQTITVTGNNKTLARNVLKAISESTYSDHNTVIGQDFSNNALAYSIGYCIRRLTDNQGLRDSIAERISNESLTVSDLTTVFEKQDISWLIKKAKDGELTAYADKKMKKETKGSSTPLPEDKPLPEEITLKTTNEQLAQAYHMLESMGEIGKAMLTVLESKASAGSSTPRGIVLRTPEGLTKYEGEEYHHMAFEKVLRYVQFSNVYLYGEASGGKTTVYKQLAKALTAIKETPIQLYTSVQLFTQHEVQGYNNATGEYTPTVFYKWFKEGGLLALDEMDRSMAKALTALNQMIENKFFTFPNGERVEMNEHSYFICSGNTPLNGTGLSSRYAASEVIDKATVDRFTAIRFDYDPVIETMMACGNDEWLEIVRSIRDAVASLKIDIVVSTRPIRDGVHAIASGA